MRTSRSGHTARRRGHIKSIGTAIAAVLVYFALLPQAPAKQIGQYPNTNALGADDMFIIELGDHSTNVNITFSQLQAIIGGGGGGDTIWTNVGSGDIQIIGSTNVTMSTNGNGNFEGTLSAVEILGTDGTTNAFLIMRPNVADGATPYVLGTSEAHTSGYLIEVPNNTTNVALMSTFGGLGIGAGFADNFGNLGANDGLIVNFLGDRTGGTSSKIKAAFDDSLDYNYGAQITLEAGGASADDAVGAITIGAYGNVSGNEWTLLGGISGGIEEGYLRFGATTLDLHPTAVDGTTAFILGTSQAHTTGDLAAIKNNGQDIYEFGVAGETWILNENGDTVFHISPNSGYTNSGTRFFSDDGTFKSVGGGGSVNPTSTFVAYNDSGSFADFPLFFLNTNSMAFGWSSYTGSDYNRLRTTLTGSALEILSEKGGGAAAVPIHFGTRDIGNVEFFVNDAAKWLISGANGDFLAADDATYNIGENGSGRPINVVVSGKLVAQGDSDGVNYTQVQINHGGNGDFAYINSIKAGTDTATPIKFQTGGADSIETDDNATANNTRLLVYDVTAGSLVRVSRGAADSGGSGKRALVIPN